MASLLIHGWISQAPMPFTVPPKPLDIIIDCVSDFIDRITLQCRWDLIHSLWEQPFALAICFLPLPIEGQVDRRIWPSHNLG